MYETQMELYVWWNETMALILKATSSTKNITTHWYLCIALLMLWNTKRVLCQNWVQPNIFCTIIMSDTGQNKTVNLSEWLFSMHTISMLNLLVLRFKLFSDTGKCIHSILRWASVIVLKIRIAIWKINWMPISLSHSVSDSQKTLFGVFTLCI